MRFRVNDLFEENILRTYGLQGDGALHADVRSIDDDLVQRHVRKTRPSPASTAEGARAAVLGGEDDELLRDGAALHNRTVGQRDDETGPDGRRRLCIARNAVP